MSINTDHSADSLTPSSGGLAIKGTVELPAGTTTAAPVMFDSTGSLVSDPGVVGAMEYNGLDFYLTPQSVSGRGYIPTAFGQVLSANGSAIGPSITDYFGSTTAISLRANQMYEVETMAYFLKTIAGTVTWTWVYSGTVTMMASHLTGNPVAGFTTTAITGTSIDDFAARQSATLAHAATASLTASVYHAHLMRMRIRTNTAADLRLRVTCSARTVTPQIGSYYKVTRMTSSGNFVA